MNSYRNNQTSGTDNTSNNTRANNEVEAVRGFYDSIVEYEWSRLDHYVLEHAIVQNYLSRYLPPPPARIIDIGGGPGRYAIMLAQQGYEVTLIDLSPLCIEWAKEKAIRAGVSIRAELGDARDLHQLAEGTFDAGLLLGPLYHLMEHKDRLMAVSELRRVLNVSGRAFTMMLTHAAAIYEGFTRWPEGILDHEGVQKLLTTGKGFNFEKNPHDFENVYFSSASEMRMLHEANDLHTLALVGCEGVLGGRRTDIERMQPMVQNAWIQLVLKICEDTDILGASERLLYVGEAI